MQLAFLSSTFPCWSPERVINSTMGIRLTWVDVWAPFELRLFVTWEEPDVFPLDSVFNKESSFSIDDITIFGWMLWGARPPDLSCWLPCNTGPLLQLNCCCDCCWDKSVIFEELFNNGTLLRVFPSPLREPSGLISLLSDKLEATYWLWFELTRFCKWTGNVHGTWSLHCCEGDDCLLGEWPLCGEWCRVPPEYGWYWWDRLSKDNRPTLASKVEPYTTNICTQ